MNKTTNYQLNQWERTDKVQMEDFNANNAKIDAAIRAVDAKADTKADKTALNALQAAVSAKGNCRMEYGTYEGDGAITRTMELTFSFQPRLVLIVGEDSFGHFIQGRTQSRCVKGKENIGLTVTWSGNSLSWRYSISVTDGAYYLNGLHTYHYVVFG